MWVGPRRRARARAEKTTPPCTSLSLLPQPPSSASTDAPQPIMCHLDAVMGGARARCRGFLLRDGCPLMSAACYSPRLLLRGLVTGRRQDAQGAAQAGGKTLRRFHFPLATLSWDPLCLLCRSAEEREPAEGSVPASGRKTLASRALEQKADVKCRRFDPIATQLEIKRLWVASDLCARPGCSTSSYRCENGA